MHASMTKNIVYKIKVVFLVLATRDVPVQFLLPDTDSDIQTCIAADMEYWKYWI